MWEQLENYEIEEQERSKMSSDEPTRIHMVGAEEYTDKTSPKSSQPKSQIPQTLDSTMAEVAMMLKEWKEWKENQKTQVNMVKQHHQNRDRMKKKITCHLCDGSHYTCSCTQFIEKYNKWLVNENFDRKTELGRYLNINSYAVQQYIKKKLNSNNIEVSHEIVIGPNTTARRLQPAATETTVGSLNQ